MLVLALKNALVWQTNRFLQFSYKSPFSTQFFVEKPEYDLNELAFWFVKQYFEDICNSIHNFFFLTEEKKYVTKFVKEVCFASQKRSESSYHCVNCS